MEQRFFCDKDISAKRHLSLVTTWAIWQLLQGRSSPSTAEYSSSDVGQSIFQGGTPHPSMLIYEPKIIFCLLRLGLTLECSPPDIARSQVEMPQKSPFYSLSLSTDLCPQARFWSPNTIPYLIIIGSKFHHQFQKVNKTWYSLVNHKS